MRVWPFQPLKHFFCKGLISLLGNIIVTMRVLQSVIVMWCFHINFIFVFKFSKFHLAILWISFDCLICNFKVIRSLYQLLLYVEWICIWLPTYCFTNGMLIHPENTENQSRPDGYNIVAIMILWYLKSI